MKNCIDKNVHHPVPDHKKESILFELCQTLKTTADSNNFNIELFFKLLFMRNSWVNVSISYKIAAEIREMSIGTFFANTIKTFCIFIDCTCQILWIVWTFSVTV